LLRDKKSAARQLMEEWAQKLKFDPLIAENWYGMPANVFQNQKVTQNKIDFIWFCLNLLLLFCGVFSFFPI
jgi:hypothetical protein